MLCLGQIAVIPVLVPISGGGYGGGHGGGYGGGHKGGYGDGGRPGVCNTCGYYLILFKIYIYIYYTNIVQKKQLLTWKVT